MCTMPPNSIKSSISIRRELHPGDVGYITYLHGTIYAEEQGFDNTFDAYVAIPLAEFSRSRSHRECIWISYVFLWTVKGLTAATNLYESFGFRKTQEETHEIWGGVITEVRYELRLR